jgi:hypothetical protein
MSSDPGLPEKYRAPAVKLYQHGRRRKERRQNEKSGKRK